MNYLDLNYQEAKERVVFSITAENKIEVGTFKDYLINLMTSNNHLTHPPIEIIEETWFKVLYFCASNDLYKAPEYFMYEDQAKMKVFEIEEADGKPPEITEVMRTFIYDGSESIFIDTEEDIFNYCSNICNSEHWNEPGFLRCTQTREEQYSMMQIAFAEDDPHYQDFIQKNKINYKNALIFALMLAIEAPDEGRVNHAVCSAEELAARLSKAEVESAKSEALLRLESNDWPKLR